MCVFLAIQLLCLHRSALHDINYHVVLLVCLLLLRRIVACFIDFHPHAANKASAPAASWSATGSSASSSFLSRLFLSSRNSQSVLAPAVSLSGAGNATHSAADSVGGNVAASEASSGKRAASGDTKEWRVKGKVGREYRPVGDKGSAGADVAAAAASATAAREPFPLTGSGVVAGGAGDGVIKASSQHNTDSFGEGGGFDSQGGGKEQLLGDDSTVKGSSLLNPGLVEAGRSSGHGQWEHHVFPPMGVVTGTCSSLILVGLYVAAVALLALKLSLTLPWQSQLLLFVPPICYAIIVALLNHQIRSLHRDAPPSAPPPSLPSLRPTSLLPASVTSDKSTNTAAAPPAAAAAAAAAATTAPLSVLPSSTVTASLPSHSLQQPLLLRQSQPTSSHPPSPPQPPSHPSGLNSHSHSQASPPSSIPLTSPSPHDCTVPQKNPLPGADSHAAGTTIQQPISLHPDFPSSNQPISVPLASQQTSEPPGEVATGRGERDGSKAGAMNGGSTDSTSTSSSNASTGIVSTSTSSNSTASLTTSSASSSVSSSRGGSMRSSSSGIGAASSGSASASSSASDFTWFTRKLRRWPKLLMRLVLVEACMGSYLVGVVPIKGTYMHEDILVSRLSCCLLLGYAFVGAAMLLLMKEAVLRREQVEYVAAHLGCWHRVDVPNFTISRDVAEWNPHSVPYSEGAIVQRGGRLFVGLGRFNTAQPGSLSAALLFLLHHQPLVFSNWVVGTQICVSFLEHVGLPWSPAHSPPMAQSPSATPPMSQSPSATPPGRSPRQPPHALAASGAPLKSEHPFSAAYFPKSPSLPSPSSLPSSPSLDVVPEEDVSLHAAALAEPNSSGSAAGAGAGSATLGSEASRSAAAGSASSAPSDRDLSGGTGREEAESCNLVPLVVEDPIIGLTESPPKAAPVLDIAPSPADAAAPVASALDSGFPRLKPIRLSAESREGVNLVASLDFGIGSLRESRGGGERDGGGGEWRAGGSARGSGGTARGSGGSARGSAGNDRGSAGNELKGGGSARTGGSGWAERRGSSPPAAGGAQQGGAHHQRQASGERSPVGSSAPSSPLPTITIGPVVVGSQVVGQQGVGQQGVGQQAQHQRQASGERSPVGSSAPSSPLPTITIAPVVTPPQQQGQQTGQQTGQQGAAQHQRQASGERSPVGSSAPSSAPSSPLPTITIGPVVVGSEVVSEEFGIRRPRGDGTLAGGGGSGNMARMLESTRHSPRGALAGGGGSGNVLGGFPHELTRSSPLGSSRTSPRTQDGSASVVTRSTSAAAESDAGERGQRVDYSEMLLLEGSGSDSDAYEDEEDVGYVRRLVEDEERFLLYELDSETDDEKGSSSKVSVGKGEGEGALTDEKGGSSSKGSEGKSMGEGKGVEEGSALDKDLSVREAEKGSSSGTTGKGVEMSFEAVQKGTGAGDGADSGSGAAGAAAGEAAGVDDGEKGRGGEGERMNGGAEAVEGGSAVDLIADFIDTRTSDAGGLDGGGAAKGADREGGRGVLLQNVIVGDGARGSGGGAGGGAEEGRRDDEQGGEGGGAGFGEDFGGFGGGGGDRGGGDGGGGFGHDGEGGGFSFHSPSSNEGLSRGNSGWSGLGEGLTPPSLGSSGAAVMGEIELEHELERMGSVADSTLEVWKKQASGTFPKLAQTASGNWDFADKGSVGGGGGEGRSEGRSGAGSEGGSARSSVGGDRRSRLSVESVEVGELGEVGGVGGEEVGKREEEKKPDEASVGEAGRGKAVGKEGGDGAGGAKRKAKSGEQAAVGDKEEGKGKEDGKGKEEGKAKEEEEFETFNLRVIHRKNRTGFEEDKDFPVVLNSVIAGRYYVTEYLGAAAFSKAIQAHDLHTGMDVCMKIIKNNKDFFDQSLDEIKLLKFINKHDPADEHHLLRMYDYFYHREHLFIICELLRANLYEFHKYNRESGGEVYFTMPRIQSIAKQILKALRFMHSLGLIHCDLKPENILIKSYSRCLVKVIDIGSSCFTWDALCSYVQSRSYRAPEVILGLPYGPKIDVWSLGCILAELCSGQVLFQNDSLATLLARVVGIIGPIDPSLLRRAKDTHKYFTRHRVLYERNPETDALEYLIPKRTSLKHRLPMGDEGFLEFVAFLLQVDPDKRPTADEALLHPWMSHEYDPIT
ncbi:unnamed protein product [Closterium sp. Yama58-4]|nr:unnamed protein product [Closterium sp. Yama58-4]